MDSNKRRACSEVAKKVAGEEVWFGIEQEYTLLDSDGRPLGWPKNGFPAPQGWAFQSIICIKACDVNVQYFIVDHTIAA